MRLTSLEVQGFKSFADHARLVFEPGVTAIVGPNGCGKSNVSDAVRWVLGEQRARLLRGAKMEEVIFQGSSARRPVSIAEVSLHFENSDGQLPVAFKEVVITRRLSRSGESEYLLNRVPCRLRDVQDLVRGTGLGADSGVVIESRMIDTLLSDRPDERRELFEEAAGVSVYRDRRRSTERRLEETGVDLSRLDDLIAEVQSQVRSLARQRKRAERYEELAERRFHVELTLASREIDLWRDELARLEARTAELRRDAPDADDAVRAAERRREDAQGARAAAEGRRAELARVAGAQRQDVMRLEGEVAVADERQRNASARRERAEEERRAGEELESQLADDREHAAGERVRLDGDAESARASLAERVAAEDEARAAVGAARAASELAERRAREMRDQGRRLELDREAAGREAAEVTQRSDALAAERATVEEALELARAALALALRTAAEARDTAARALDASATAKSGAGAARDHEAAARAELFRAEEAHTSLEGRVSALETLERERVGLAPAAARLLKDRGQFDAGAILGPLSDFITSSAASAVLLERFLGATLHAVLVRDRTAADSVRRWHARVSPGPLLVLPADAQPLRERTGQEFAALADASDFARGWVSALLADVSPLDEGSAFLDARGAVWLPGSITGAGPLRRRAELAALRAELAGSEAARGAASADADAAHLALAAAEHAATAAAEAAAAAQGAVRRADDESTEAERRCKRGEREVANLAAVAERLAARREELGRRAATIDAQTRTLADSISAFEDGARAARERLADMERRQEEARDARTHWQVELAQIQARLQVAADRERRLASEASTATARLRALVAELTDIERADSALAQRMATWRLDLEARRNALGDVEGRLTDAEGAVGGVERHLAECDRATDEARRRAAGLAEALHQAELRLTELSGRRSAIRGRLEAEWKRPLDEMLAALTPVQVDDAALRTEHATLRTQLEELGQVNPLAIEEHQEEMKRLDFLSGQRADLASAKHSLLQAVREIDVTARELFLATFAQVRENFRQIFMTLFGGGECDIRLENGEAPLDCDIEIHASPRGKRTQRIHLLSSGERALVALSLLFGIFLTKPSPFCLLDEVDAPLDDQNVGRFVRMLNQFKERTQFIVITHNPRTTTEAADAVYGVTMQEPGVSSVVSVRMRQRAGASDTAADGAEDAEAVAATA
ncbi:MAG: chromosome segregation protein SMC [Gemmatimonadaceae bacterium]